MQEPQDDVVGALYGAAWNEPLPAVIYQDIAKDVLLDDEEYVLIREKRAEVHESFRIDDQGKANWAIRRIGEARKRWA